MSFEPTVHVPVLLAEVVAGLAPRTGMTVVDGTLGGGGHALALARAVAPAGTVIGVDRDPGAIERVIQRRTGEPLMVVHGNFTEIPEILSNNDLLPVDAVLLDLGLSSDQLADRDRGFSFQGDGPLDLRFDPECGEPTWRWLNRIGEQHLANLIFEYGEERYSRRIAKAIVQRRRIAPLQTAGELADIVRTAVPRPKPGRYRIDPATRTFQAIRIAANEELQALEHALERLPDVLRPGGRFAVISFHSLEDRRVKNAFRDDDRLSIITKRVITAGDEEVERNPRARSAKLRIAARN